VRANPAGTYDGSVIAVRTLGTLVPGNYPVDLTTGSAMFLFVDEAQQFSLPDTLTEDGIRQWLQDLAAEHILASVSGSIQVAEASSDTLHGTFSGLTADSSNPLLLVNVSSGRFALSGLDDPVSAVDLPRRGTPSLAVAPNPFNPLTTAAFRLPTTQRIDAAVYDLTGRLVRVLHAGELPAGEHRLTWHGCDRADRRAPAGVYLMRVRGPGWQECAKVALVP